MAKIILTGGYKVSISHEKAKEVEHMKSNPSAYSFNHLVDLGNRSVELGRIKDIIFDEKNEQAYQNSLDERSQRIEKWNVEWNQWRQKISQNDPEEKTEWFMRGPLYLFWKSRRNKANITQEIVDILKPKIIKYFKENPDKAWCPREIYIKYIPKIDPEFTSETSFSSFAQIIDGKQKIQTEIEFEKEISIEDINF